MNYVAKTSDDGHYDWGLIKLNEPMDDLGVINIKKASEAESTALGNVFIAGYPSMGTGSENDSHVGGRRSSLRLCFGKRDTELQNQHFRRKQQDLPLVSGGTAKQPWYSCYGKRCREYRKGNR